MPERNHWEEAGREAAMRLACVSLLGGLSGSTQAVYATSINSSVPALPGADHAPRLGY